MSRAGRCFSSWRSTPDPDATTWVGASTARLLHTGLTSWAEREAFTMPRRLRRSGDHGRPRRGKRGANSRERARNYLISKRFVSDGVKVGPEARSRTEWLIITLGVAVREPCRCLVRN
jgi:hypothetical protein